MSGEYASPLSLFPLLFGQKDTGQTGSCPSLMAWQGWRSGPHGRPSERSHHLAQGVGLQPWRPPHSPGSAWLAVLIPPRGCKGPQMVTVQPHFPPVLRAGDRQACSPLPTHRSLTPPQKSLLLREKSPRSLATEESARRKRSLNSQSNQNYFSKQYPVTS